jgi:hypothetical protein
MKQNELDILREIKLLISTKFQCEPDEKRSIQSLLNFLTEILGSCIAVLPQDLESKLKVLEIARRAMECIILEHCDDTKM